MANILDDILRLVRLRACVYFVRDVEAPWGFDLPDLQVAPVHVILDGTASVRDHDGNLALLGPGDAALFPTGGAHRIGRARNEEQSSTTRLLCGHFEWDTQASMPLAAELPDVMVVRDLFASEDGPTLRQVVAMIETGAPRSAEDEPEGSILADRLGEVLFVGLLRRWVDLALPRTGLLACMHDARLSRALQHMHDNPGANLDVRELASIAGMSRTAFAVRFREILGVPPNAYLTEWRLFVAHNLLADTELPLEEIVDRVGYDSPSGFSRAFKRRYGISPGMHRHNVRVAL